MLYENSRMIHDVFVNNVEYQFNLHEPCGVPDEHCCSVQDT